MPHPDNFNDAAFERTWGEDPPVDTRNEDEIIEAREDSKNYFDAIMRGLAKIQFEGDTAKGLAYLTGVNAALAKLPNSAMKGFSVREEAKKIADDL